MQDDRIIRMDEVKAIVGLGRTSIYTMERDGSFPRRVNLGGRAVGWSLNEILEWVNEKKALRVAG